MTTTDETGVDEKDDVEAKDTKTIKLYNANDGIVGRPAGIYLDEEEMREAERRRAIVEDREPDYDNMGSTAGVHLVPAHLLGTHLNQVGTHFDEVAHDGLFRPETAPRVYAEAEVPIPGGSNVTLSPGPGEDSPSIDPAVLAARGREESAGSTLSEPTPSEKKEDSSSVLDSPSTDSDSGKSSVSSAGSKTSTAKSAKSS